MDLMDSKNVNNRIKKRSIAIASYCSSLFCSLYFGRITNTAFTGWFHNRHSVGKRY